MKKRGNQAAVKKGKSKKKAQNLLLQFPKVEKEKQNKKKKQNPKKKIEKVKRQKKNRNLKNLKSYIHYRVFTWGGF